jgi:hypothetical protein
LKLPCFTGAISDASAADAVDGHLYQAMGPPMTSAAIKSGSQRLRSCCIVKTLEDGCLPRATRAATKESSHHLSSGTCKLQCELDYEMMNIGQPNAAGDSGS